MSVGPRPRWGGSTPLPGGRRHVVGPALIQFGPDSVGVGKEGEPLVPFFERRDPDPRSEGLKARDRLREVVHAEPQVVELVSFAVGRGPWVEIQFQHGAGLRIYQFLPQSPGSHATAGAKSQAEAIGVEPNRTGELTDAYPRVLQHAGVFGARIFEPAPPSAEGRRS